MKKKTALIFTGIFLVVVIVTGFCCYVNLADYYINNKVVDNEYVDSMGSKFETDIASTFFKRFSFININGAIRKLLGQHVMNGVVKLENGYLTVPEEKCPDELIRQFADRTAWLNTYLQKRGTSLVYVSPPFTVNKYDQELPVGVEDYGNENLDQLLVHLNENGIDTIDLREVMAADGIDLYDMMYKTDHHWTTEAGFYAYQIIESYIKEKTGCEVDPRISDLSNYTLTNYEKWHLGSRGQRTGIYYAGIDDFLLIEPDFETHITNANGKKGSIQDLFIERKPLEKRDTTSLYTYDQVLGSGAYLGQYTNSDSFNDVKVMIVTDSFGKAVNPYLVMGFRALYSLNDSYVGLITPEMVEDFDPDVMILLYCPKQIFKDSGSFEFIKFYE